MGRRAETLQSVWVFLVVFGLSWAILSGIVPDSRFDTDFPEHLASVRQWLAGTADLPAHFLFHALTAAGVGFGLSLDVAAIAVLSASVGASAVIVYTLYLSPGAPSGARAACAIIACVATAIYAHGFNSLYTGQSSPTIWHNPTGMLLKPFALASAICVERIVYGGASRSTYVVAAATLLLGLIAKPAFVLVFTPVAAVIAVFMALPARWRPRFDWLMSADRRARTGLLALVVIAGVALWIQARYILPVRPGVELRPLLVWSGYTPSIAFSLLLVLAFPLSATMLDLRNRVPVRGLAIAWGYLAVGALIFGLLAEKGLIRTHGNLGWGFQVALSVLYAFALRSYLGHWSARRRGWEFTTATTLLVLHVASGVYYLYQILALRSYD